MKRILKLIGIIVIGTVGVVSFDLVILQRTHRVTVTVVDDNGETVKNATVIISYTRPLARDSRTHQGSTKNRGTFSARDNFLMGVFIRVTHPEFYEFTNSFREDEREISVTLRRKVNPIPLIVRDVTLEFPVQGEWIGFDFDAGDWVTPHGKGKNEDIRFQFEHSFLRYNYEGRKLAEALEMSKRAANARQEEWTEEQFKKRVGVWKGRMDVSFPNEKGGIIRERYRYLRHSKMLMPNQAPEEGYEATLRLRDPGTPRNRPGYFIRTRIDDKNPSGTVAHYAKTQGDFEFSAARSRVSFIYYFNPRENDRNPEFDPKQNLASDQQRWFTP